MPASASRATRPLHDFSNGNGHVPSRKPEPQVTTEGSSFLPLFYSLRLTLYFQGDRYTLVTPQKPDGHSWLEHRSVGSENIWELTDVMGMLRLRPKADRLGWAQFRLYVSIPRKSNANSGSSQNCVSGIAS